LKTDTPGSTHNGMLLQLILTMSVVAVFASTLCPAISTYQNSVTSIAKTDGSHKIQKKLLQQSNDEDQWVFQDDKPKKVKPSDIIDEDDKAGPLTKYIEFITGLKSR
jgi:lipopolysaccharide export LptBFGC system permease protein LptF